MSNDPPEIDKAKIDKAKIDKAKIDKAKIDKAKIDKHGELEGEPFSYCALKNGSVLLEHQGRTVKTISGDEAERFLKRIADLEGLAEQLVLAKITGNFKRGNERASKPR